MSTFRKTGIKLKIGIILALAVAALCACRQENIEPGMLSEPESEEADNVQLNLFYSGDNTGWIASMEELREEFMKAYPRINLNMEYSRSDSYTEELKTKEAIGEFPDVFEIENPYMFEEAGKLGVIDEEISDLIEDPIKINGKDYALPFYSTSYGIVYNKVIFKEYNLSVPKTYSEFLSLCKKLKSHGIAPLAVGGSEESSIFGWMNYFFLTEVEAEQNGWQERRTSGEVSFQDENMLQALEDFQDLMTGDYVLEYSVNMGDNQIISNMINQKVAMYYGTPEMLVKIWDAYPAAMDSGKTPLGEELENDTTQIRLGWFYLPDDHGKSIVINKIGSIWSVSAECMQDEKKKDAVNTFLKFCYEKDNYRKILQAMYGMPITKSAVLYAAPAVQQDVLTGYRYADRSDDYLGNFDTPEDFQIDMLNILDSLARNSIRTESAAQLLDESWEKAVQEHEMEDLGKIQE